MARNWRLARSLETLRGQINAAYPARRKNSDGTIGDAAHASRASDHNPNARGVVTAFDCTHDPANGVDCDKLAAALQRSKDPRVKYIIWKGRITRKGDPSRWKPYAGANKHTTHLHLSVSSDPSLYDFAAPWKLDAFLPAARQQATAPETPPAGGVAGAVGEGGGDVSGASEGAPVAPTPSPEPLYTADDVLEQAQGDELADPGQVFAFAEWMEMKHELEAFRERDSQRKMQEQQQPPPVQPAIMLDPSETLDAAFYKALALGVLRILLASASTWLIAKGYLTQAQNEMLLTGAAGLVCTLVWSALHKKKVRRVIEAALSAPEGASYAQAKQLMRGK